MGLVEDVCKKITNAKTPKVEDGRLEIILGIVNLIFFGVGTIIGGVLDDCDVPDIVIGLLQLFLFAIGWIWSIIWGILMILKK